MTHAYAAMHLAAERQLIQAKALLTENARRQVGIMKEVIELFGIHELKLDKRYAGLFSYDFIKVEVSDAGRATFSLWEDAYADMPEEYVGEFNLSELILDGRDADFRLEFEAELAKVAEAFRERAEAQRDAEIARARKTLEQLERQREAITAYNQSRSQA